MHPLEKRPSIRSLSLGNETLKSNDVTYILRNWTLGFGALMLLFLAHCRASDQPTPPKAVRGVLDLTHVKWGGAPLALDGEWEFYPNEFIDPEDSLKASGTIPNNGSNLRISPAYLTVPGNWNSVLGGGDGFGSYRLTILLPDSVRTPLSFKVMEQGTAYVLFANGKKIASNGTVGTTGVTSVPQLLSLISVAIPADRRVEVIFHVSNFHYRIGGLWRPTVFGNEEALRRITEKNLLLDMFLSGSILIMGLYHLVLYLLRKRDKSTLFFALFCFVIIARLLSTGERYLHHLLPGIPFEGMLKIELVGFFLPLPLFCHFLNIVFPSQFSRRILILIWAVGSLFSLLVLVTPSRIYSQSVNYYEVFTLACCIYFLYFIGSAIYHHVPGSKTFFLGSLTLFVGVVNDTLSALGIIDTAYIFPHSLLGFIFAQSVILSMRFSRSFRQVEELSENLELKVTERTNTLARTLDAVRRDLALARKIQLATLSNLQNFKGLINLHGVYTPLNEVGGDIFNVNVVRPDLLRIFLADATGHGVQAALVTMTIVSLYESLKNSEEPPDELLLALNQSFMKSYRSLNAFFTAGILDIDLITGKVTYAGGGHPYPLLVNENGESELLKSRGSLLGVRDSYNCTRIETTMSRETSLYFFTDGAFEEFNSAREEFGIERLERILIEERSKSLPDIAAIVQQKLQEFRGDSPTNDDLTIIGIRMLPRQAS